MSRNYGIMSDRQRLGGVSTLPATTRDEIHTRDSNSSDRELGAFCFALFGLTCPFALFGAAILFWLLFVS